MAKRKAKRVTAKRTATNQSTGIKKLWSNPKFRAKMSRSGKAVMKRLWASRKFRSRVASAIRAKWKDPEFRAKMVKAVKAARAKA